MMKTLRDRGLPVVLLAVAAVAVALFFLRPSLLVTGLLGAVFGVTAMVAAAFAVYLLLFKLVARAGRFPDPPAVAVIGYVVAAAVLVGLIVSVEPDPGARALVGTVGPVVGVVMFVAALWFSRKAAAEPTAAGRRGA